VTRYWHLADELERLIARGTFAKGDRMPSVRSLANQHGVSQGTVLRVYEVLRSRGLIEQRRRSGYYVTAPLSQASVKT
jgi:DNA-binding GntR family transcriptional regulator